MSKNLKVSPAERIDIPDFNEAATDFTEAERQQLIERSILDRRSRVVDGFRVQVADQTSFPGQITIYNGTALDRNGSMLTNEQQSNTARTITLLGTNTIFYLEIEFFKSDSDVDARFFWDPTAANTPPVPPGQEFSLNVATRQTPDWRIVTPVSTTGFSQTTNPNSLRIPIGAFKTNGSNIIGTGGNNPGLAFVAPASVLESDVAVSATKLRVIDARIFPATFPFTITVDVGGASPETKSCSALDRDNSILTITSGLANSHIAGAIIRVTATADFVKENTDPSNPTLDPTLSPPGHPDPAQRLWEGNELRGAALVSSKETPSGRDDLNLRSLKDYVDYMSALMRDLKFGNPRPDSSSNAPVASYGTRPRYFDRVGSVAGARTNVISIGNGTTSFGDLNGTTQAVFNTAMNALPSAGGIIYVHPGTYTFASPMSVAKKITIVGSPAVTITNVDGTVNMFTVSADVEFEDLNIVKSAAGSAPAIDVTVDSTFVRFTRVLLTGPCRANNAAVIFKGTNSQFAQVDTTGGLFNINGTGSLFDCSFVGCTFLNSTSVIGVLNGPVSNNSFYDCNIFVGGYAFFQSAGTWDGLSVKNCRINCSNSLTVAGVFVSAGTASNNINFSDCSLTMATTNTTNPTFWCTSSVANVTGFSLCRNNFIISASSGTSSGSPGAVVRLSPSTSVVDILIDSNICTMPSSSTITFVYLDPGFISGMVTVSNNEVLKPFSLVTVATATGSGNGRIRVVGNHCNNVATHANAYGVLITSTHADAIEVSGNIFKNFNNGSNTIAVGVYVAASAGSANMDLLIHDNAFYNFGSASGANIAGVFVEPTATARTINVTDNMITSLDGVSVLGIGIYVGTGSVKGNNISTLGDVTNTTSCIGIVAASSDFVVSGNRIKEIAANGATVASGIAVQASRVSVIGNDIVNVYAVSPGSSALVSGITLVNAMNNVVVSGNTIDNSGSAQLSPVGIAHSIAASIGAIYNINIFGNTIISKTTSVNGILVTCADTGLGTSTTTINSYNIHGNDVRMNTGSGNAFQAIAAFVVRFTNGFIIEGNNIQEITSGNQHIGIDVLGDQHGGGSVHPKGILIKGNNLYGNLTGASSSTSRIGIRMRDVEFSSIVSNIVAWNIAGGPKGNGIMLTSLSGELYQGFCVVGNNVTPDGDAGAVGDELFIDNTKMQDGLNDANIFGNSSVTGTQTASGGSWLYGSVKLS